jgi:flagellar basal-body rod protein FlgG
MTIRALYISATGMEAQQVNVDNISNNIANTNTTAYKRGRVGFEDLIYEQLVAAGVNSSSNGNVVPTGISIGLGTRVSTIYKVFEQGSLNPTPATPLNTAIDGVGFYKITLPNGDIGYTRDGSFQLNQNGDMVNSIGYLLEPSINIPIDSTNLTISTDGKVQVTVNSVIQDQGQIPLVRFANPAGLEPIGGNLYLATEASGDPVEGTAGDTGYGIIRQNFLENSNVNAVTEVTELIKAQRAFELCSKSMQAAEQMARTIIDSKA